VTADLTTAAGRRPLPPTALVIELGRSAGSSAVAAGIALARARQLGGDGWVLLAELDPRGGDLLERLALGSVPRVRVIDELPAGAARLAEHLAGVEFVGGLGDATSVSARAVLVDHVVEVAGVPGVRVLLGDHLVDGASRAAAVVTRQLPNLARGAGAAAVVIDGGGWTSAQPQRLAVADVVYAVIQASSASQNARCLAELSALWRLLATGSRPAQLFGVVIEPSHDSEELVALFGAAGRPGGSGRHRIAVLHGGSDRRALSRLAAGQWRGLSDRALQRFAVLARPLGRPPAAAAGPTAPAPALSQRTAIDEHAYLLADASPAPPAGERPAPNSNGSETGRSAEPDPGFWPFDDGALLDGAGRWTDLEPAPAMEPTPGRLDRER